MSGRKLRVDTMTKTTTADQPDLTPATIADTTPATTSGALDLSDNEWEGVGDGDLSPAEARSIPLLSLFRKAGQSQSGFTDTETGERSMEIDAVLLAKGTTRAWWPEAFGKGEERPDCRSADGLVPDPASPNVQASACATCKNARWESYVDLKAEPDFRSCKKSLELLVFLPEAAGGRLARLRMGGLAYSPTQSYWDGFKSRIPPVPPLSALTRIELDTVDCPPNGEFLVPRYSRTLTFTRDEVRPLIEERDRRIAEWTATVAEDVATGATREPEPTHAAAPTGDPGSYEPTDDYGEPF